MKRSSYIAALLCLVACSSDDVTEQSADNEIKFDIVTDNMTRATLHSSSDELTNCTVWATISPSTGATSFTKYIDGESLTVSESGCTLSGGTRYWPSDGSTLDFFGLHGFSSTQNCSSSTSIPGTIGSNPISLSSSSTKLTVTGISIPEDARNQEDILYAVTKKVGNTSSTNGKVTLNFRHALAQLCFTAVNKSPYLAVLINKVSVVHIYNGNGTAASGTTYNNSPKTLVFGSSNTNSTYKSSDKSSVNNRYTNCTWSTVPSSNPTSTSSTRAGTGSTYFQAQESNANSTTAFYKLNPATVSTSSGTTTVTDTNLTWDTSSSNTSVPILVIPQSFNFEKGMSSVSNNAPLDNYVYIVLSCRAYNITDISSYTTSTDLTDSSKATLIFGDDNSSFKDIYIKVPNVTYSSTYGWLAGNKYTYNLVFGDGDGTTGYDENGNETLVPISVNVTTDVWSDTDGDSSTQNDFNL